MPNSTNDVRVLRRSTLYNLAVHGNLFDVQASVDGFPLYLLVDSRYPFLLWLMMLHHGHYISIIMELLFN